MFFYWPEDFLGFRCFMYIYIYILFIYILYIYTYYIYILPYISYICIYIYIQYVLQLYYTYMYIYMYIYIYLMRHIFWNIINNQPKWEYLLDKPTGYSLEEVQFTKGSTAMPGHWASYQVDSNSRLAVPLFEYRRSGAQMAQKLMFGSLFVGTSTG